MADPGKLKKRAPELLVLSDPYYVKNIIECRNPGEETSRQKQEFLGLIARFDLKELNAVCSCGKQAKYLAFYKGTFFNEIWCGECSPFWLENFGGRMDIFCSYVSALAYVNVYCYGDRPLLKAMVRKIARLKGLPQKLNAREAKSFFRGAEIITTD